MKSLGEEVRVTSVLHVDFGGEIWLNVSIW